MDAEVNRTVRRAAIVAAGLVVEGAAIAAPPPPPFAKLRAADGAPFQLFGSGAAIEGDLLVVGAFGRNDRGPGSGGAFAFRRTESGWVEEAALLPASIGANSSFGLGCRMSGTTCVIGAPLHQSVEPIVDGAVFVFARRGDGTWAEEAMLAAPYGGTGDSFGWDSAIDGDTVVVGAFRDDHDSGDDGGSAYVFVREGGVWTEQAKLVPADVGEGANAGSSVAIDGDVVVLGAPGATNEAGERTGALYVFERVDGVWTERAKLLAPDGRPDDGLGNSGSVSVSGDTILAGAWFGDAPGRPDTGAAYVFNRKGGRWRFAQKLEAPPLEPATPGNVNPRFGFRTALRGDLAVVPMNSRDIDGAEGVGAAFVYQRVGTGWFLRGELQNPDVAAYDYFGWSPAIGDDEVVVAAVGDDIEQGSATVFSGMRLWASRVDVRSLSIALKFAAGVPDRITLAARVPPVGVPDSLDGRTATVTVGPLVRTVTLDAKGRGTSGDTTVSVKRGRPGKPATVTVTVKGDFSADLAPLGMDGSADAKKVRTPVGGSIDLGAGPVTIEAAVTFSGKSGRSGTAALVRP